VAELSLILVLMIKAFYSVMRSSTLVPFRTFLSVSKLTELGSVEVVVSTLVFYRVEVVATLVVMSQVFFGTFYPFEVLQIQMFELDGFPSAMMHFRKIDKNFIFS